MSDPADDRRLTRLYERVRAYVAGWTEAQPHDPGIALAQLFAYLADALSAYQDELGREARLGWRRFVGVRLQEGRVVIDSDWTSHPGGERYGLYRGVVVDPTDPQVRGRILVTIPAVLQGVSAWAVPSVPSGSTPVPPPIGTEVWIAFEEGDVDRPVWLGVIS
jgi:hypothetical protein